jgi:threonyl-tRNA synthetase
MWVSCSICVTIVQNGLGISPTLQKEYATEIATKLSESGLFADVDNGADTLSKKIRNGEIAQYNFILGTSYLSVPFK